MVNEEHVRAAAIVLAIKQMRDCHGKALEVTLSGAVIEGLEGEPYVITVEPLSSESKNSCQLPTDNKSKLSDVTPNCKTCSTLTSCGIFDTVDYCSNYKPA